MKQFLKPWSMWMWIPAILIWGLIGYLKVYHNFRSKAFREGYERGAIHCAGYHKKFGEYPSIKWRAENWNMINRDTWWMQKEDAK